MTMKLYREENFVDIADAIRDNYLSEKPTKQYKPREMATAINDMSKDIANEYGKYIPTENFNNSEDYLENTTGLPIKLNSVNGNIKQEGTPTIDNPSEVKIPINNDIVVSNGKNGEEHKEQVYTLDSSNRNLLINNATSQTSNGITTKVNSDKTITCNGTASATTDFYILGSASEYKSLDIVGNYYLSGCSNGSGTKYMLYMVQKNSSGTLYYYQCYTTPIAITINSGDTFRVFIRVLSGQTINETIKPMISSSQELTYVPYDETYNYPIYNESDYYYKKDNEWYVHNEWVKVNASDISNIGVTANQGLYFYEMGINTTRNSVYSNVLINKSTTDDSWNALDGKYIGQLYNIGQIYINKKFSTIAEAKQWLVSNNFYMIYKLATPTETKIENNTLISQLEAINKWRTYEGGTNISQKSNSTPIKIDMDYFIANVAQVQTLSLESEEE